MIDQPISRLDRERPAEDALVDGCGNDRKHSADGRVRLTLRICIARQDGDQPLSGLDAAPGLGATPIGRRSVMLTVQLLPPEK